MIINATQKHTTTIRINYTIISICKEKKIEISSLLRSTFQFIFVLDNYHKDDINEICKNIIEEYQFSESIPLSNESKKVETYLTAAQYDAYKKLPRKNRTNIVNKLISIAINNYGYTNMENSNSKKISKDPIINSFTILFFINNILDSDINIYIMESLIGKMEYVIKNKRVGENFYKNIYTNLFSKNDSNDFINQEKNFIFLLEQFKRIYFCMIYIYDIKLSKKSKESSARKIKKEYKVLLREKYENDIQKFLENEIVIDNNLSVVKQIDEFGNFIKALYPHEKEEYIIKTSLFKILRMIETSYNMQKTLNLRENINVIEKFDLYAHLKETKKNSQNKEDEFNLISTIKKLSQITIDLYFLSKR